MFCSSCGTQMEEGTLFCPNCGKSVDDNLAVNETANNGAQQPEGAYQYYNPNPVLGLKWAHFLGYFALWAGALLNLVTGFQCITGLIYGGDAGLVYAFYGGLQVLNILYGICLLGVVALGVITALSIIKCKKQTGKLVCLVYLVQSVLTVVYLIGTSIILGSFAGDASVIMQIVISIVMIFVNRTYFNNRRDVYVN